MFATRVKDVASVGVHLKKFGLEGKYEIYVLRTVPHMPGGSRWNRDRAVDPHSDPKPTYCTVQYSTMYSTVKYFDER